MGDKSSARLLGEATIANVGGDNAHGDYEVRLSSTAPSGESKGFVKGAEIASGEPPGRDTYRVGHVKGYPRLSLVMWHLISRALAAALGEPPLHKRGRKPSPIEAGNGDPMTTGWIG